MKSMKLLDKLVKSTLLDRQGIKTSRNSISMRN